MDNVKISEEVFTATSFSDIADFINRNFTMFGNYINSQNERIAELEKRVAELEAKVNQKHPTTASA